MKHDHYTILDRLTKREEEVLRLLAQGMTNREIAKKLFLTPKTVETHVNHILSKLGVSNRCKAMAVALYLNLVTLDIRVITQDQMADN